MNIGYKIMIGFFLVAFASRFVWAAWHIWKKRKDKVKKENPDDDLQTYQL